MGLALSLIVYFLATVTSAILCVTNNIIDFDATPVTDQTGLAIFCVVLVLITEWLCLIAVKNPVLFLGKRKKKREFEDFLNKNLIAGTSFKAFKEKYDRCAQIERGKWQIEVYKGSHNERKCRVFIHFLKKEKIFIFFRNRCNNIRTLFNIPLFIYLGRSVGGFPADGVPSTVYIAFGLSILYPLIMYLLFYSNGTLHGMIDGTIRLRELDAEEELAHKVAFGKEFSICNDCDKIVENYKIKETYEAPDFDGYTTSHTTYKDALKGKIQIGDTAIPIYVTDKDETTVTAYGYRHKECYCPYCGKFQYRYSEKETATRKYKW